MSNRIFHFPVRLQGWVRVEADLDEFRITAIDISREFAELRTDVKPFEQVDGDDEDISPELAASVWEVTRGVRPADLENIEVEGIPFFEAER